MNSSTSSKTRRPLQINVGNHSSTGAPVAAALDDAPEPIRAFEAFEWMGSEEVEEVHGYRIANFINVTDDFAGGIALILQIMQRHELDDFSDTERYFNATQLGQLEAFAIRAALELRDKAQFLRAELAKRGGKQP